MEKIRRRSASNDLKHLLQQGAQSVARSYHERKSGKRFWLNDMEAILGIMLILLILGTVNVFSSSFVHAEIQQDNPYFFLKRQIISVIIGLIFCAIGSMVDYHKWRHFMPLVVFAMLGLLIAVPIFGAEVNGARRWISLPLFGQFQPAEGAKVVSIMMAAAYLSSRIHRGLRCISLSPQYLLIFLMAGLVYKEPDMGTAIIIGGVPIIMYCVAGRLNLKQFLYTLAGLGVLGTLFCLSKPYRIKRLEVYFDPWQDAQGTGYQTVESLASIGSGGFFGMGLGIGVSKYAYLPEAHTDFAFAIFCQENGYIGALFVFLLFGMLIYHGFRITQRAEDSFGKLLAFGIITLIGGQALVNMLMVSGLLPVVGVPLPFISYGGTSLLFTMFAMGMLINIGRVSERMKRQRKRRQHEAETQEAAPAPRKLHLVRESTGSVRPRRRS